MTESMAESLLESARRKLEDARAQADDALPLLYEAELCLKEALELDPGNGAISAQLERVRSLVEEEEQRASGGPSGAVDQDAQPQEQPDDSREAGGVCPGCGRPITAEQAICTGCGLNLRTGKRLTTSASGDAALDERIPQRNALIPAGIAAAILLAGAAAYLAVAPLLAEHTRLTRELEDKDPAVRRDAARALAETGPAAREAVPALLRASRDADDDARREAATALQAIGPAAVPALIEALKDKKLSVRRSAADALGRIGPAAKEAVPALEQALKDRAPPMCRSAASALERIDPAAVKTSVLEMIRALKGHLARIGVLHGSTAQRAHITRASGDPPPDMRDAYKDQRASTLLRPLHGLGPAAVPALIEALEGTDPDVRETAAHVLANIVCSVPMDGAVPALVKALGDANPNVRRCAASVLGINHSYGAFRTRASVPASAPAKETVRALANASSDSDVGVRRSAALALMQIGPWARDVTPALIRASGDRDRMVSGPASNALNHARRAAKSRRVAEAHYWRGVAYARKSDHDRAIAEFTKAIEFDPDSALVYGRRGVSYGQKGDHARAAADLRKAIKLDPDGPAGRQARDSLRRLGE